MLNFLLQVSTAGPEIDPNVAGKGLIDAISQSHWTLVIGFAVMLIVWIIRVFVRPNINPKYLPWVAVAIATLGTAAVALVADPAAWLTAVFAGIQAGLGAAGTYGLLPKKLKEATKAKAKAKVDAKPI